MKTNKCILDQTCFDCKKTPRFDGFISDNQYACPEMSCIICQSCKDKMVGIQKNPLMFIHNIIGPKNSNWYCCHYNPHKLKRCSIQVHTYIFLLHFMIKSYVNRTGKVKMTNSNFYENHKFLLLLQLF